MNDPLGESHLSNNKYGIAIYDVQIVYRKIHDNFK